MTDGERCPHCGSNATAGGWCTSCSQPIKPVLPLAVRLKDRAAHRARVRAQAKQRRREENCRQHVWSEPVGTPSPDIVRQQCTRCGATRQVEPEEAR